MVYLSIKDNFFFSIAATHFGGQIIKVDVSSSVTMLCCRVLGGAKNPPFRQARLRLGLYAF